MNEPQNITITLDEYRDLCRTADTLDWLQGQGMCWRCADNLVNGWVIGDETEWHYRISGDVRDLVDQHRDLLSNN